MLSAGKSVYWIAFSKTVRPLPSSQASFARAVGIDRQLPDLEFLARNRFLEALREGDLVEQPVGAALVGDVFGAVGKEDPAHQAVAVPMFAAGELRQRGGAQLDALPRPQRAAHAGGSARRVHWAGAAGPARRNCCGRRCNRISVAGAEQDAGIGAGCRLARLHVKPIGMQRDLATDSDAALVQRRSYSSGSRPSASASFSSCARAWR